MKASHAFRLISELVKVHLISIIFNSKGQPKDSGKGDKGWNLVEWLESLSPSEKLSIKIPPKG